MTGDTIHVPRPNSPRINAIKRRLVHELRVVRARRVAKEYCDLWAGLVSRKKLPPDPFRLIRKLFRHTSRPGNFAKADGYLNWCRERRHLPYPDAILFKLLPKQADLGLIPRWTPDPVKY